MTLAIYDRFITKTDSGETIPSATVSIFNAESGSLATLYADIDGATPAGNPVTASANGRIQVYMSPGRYNVFAVSAGASINYPNVVVGADASTTDLTVNGESTNVETYLNRVNLDFSSVAEMKANAQGLINVAGQKVSTGATHWKIVAATSDRGILLTGGLKAFPLNGLWAEDYGVTGDFDYTTDSGTDDTAALQLAVNDLVEISQSLRIQALTPAEVNYRTASRVTLKLGYGISYMAGTVHVPADTYASNISISGEGYAFVGNEINTGFSFNGMANKNDFENVVFSRFGTALFLNTDNVNEAMITFNNVQSMGNDIFINTDGYDESRSTMMIFNNCTFSDTRRVINCYTDMVTFNDCWTYAKYRTNDPLFLLSGDSSAKFNRCFFIPHGENYGPANQKSFIMFLCDPDESRPDDRSLRHLELDGCRMSLESSRGLIWFRDLNDPYTVQGGKVTSIKIKDTVLSGTGGQAAIIYKQGFPSTVSFDNAKFLAVGSLCSIDPENTNPPTPATPEDTVTHTISVDEATRANLQFSGNGYMSDALKPFVYSTTSHTSRFKRSIKTDIDYRLPSVLAPTVSASAVKTTIPVYFDKTRTSNTPCRDVLTFMVTLVSDARGQATSNPHYSSSSTSIVTVTGDNANGGQRLIQHTVLQDAKGGIAAASSAAPISIHWGEGDTGSSFIDVSPLVATGDEDYITIVWGGASNAQFAWAYIVPLAGSSDNTVATYRINGVW